MDAYNIGAAMKAAVPAGNAIGLTAHMLCNVQDGDRVVAFSTDEAQNFQKEIDARKLQNVQVMIAEPKHFFTLDKHGPAVGRMHFSPNWVARYYEAALQRAADDLAFYQAKLSGKL